MYRKIEDVTLRTGEKTELGVVTGPDHDWGKKVRHLLGHKGESWLWQVEQSLFNETGTESYFYILSKEGKPFASIMTVEREGIGTFGHVFTDPKERKKGAADLIHHYQMEDFKSRNGRALYLGTSYDSHAYHLYQKHGFVGCEPESGSMFYFTRGQEAFEKETFAPSPTTIERLAFKHWPLLPALAMMKHPARIRILGMGVNRIVSTEGTSLEFLHRFAQSDRSLDAYLAVSSKTLVPMAIACRRPEADHFGNHVDLVDIFAAPHHEEQIPGLVEALALDPKRKAICYMDDGWPAKSNWLKKCGFQREATLKKHFLSQTRELHDVEVWSRV